MGEGILDSAHVLDYYPQPVATTRCEPARKIAIVLSLEVKEDYLDEFLAVAVRDHVTLCCSTVHQWPTTSFCFCCCCCAAVVLLSG